VRHNPRSKPVHEWQPTEGVGWQHGDPPRAPDGLLKASREAWTTWMAAWFASHWTPSDLPGLRQLVRLYDQVERGEFQRMGELRMGMDTYGITPKGQQDRRWKAPEQPDESKPTGSKGSAYGRLRAVAE
jgi:hypothetical protein